MAKNLTTFAPGMSGATKIGQNDWYNEIVMPGQGCTARCGPRNGDQGTANHVFKFPTNTGYGGTVNDQTPATEIKLWMVNPGSQGAGGNCCGWGAPGTSGAKAVFDINTNMPDGQRCIRICTANGGCCIAALDGQQSCRWRILSHDENRCMFLFTTATCGCWECNFYNSSKCNEICYMGGGSGPVRCWDSKETCSSSSSYWCNPEIVGQVNDPQYVQPDSDVNVFKQQVGYAVAGCCSDQARNITMVFPINHWCTQKAHYVGVKGMGYDCNNAGGTLMCGLARIWGGTNHGLGRGGICEAGVGGVPAIAGGGNCYCGGPGGAGFMMFWYK